MASPKPVELRPDWERWFLVEGGESKEGEKVVFFLPCQGEGKQERAVPGVRFSSAGSG